MFLTAIVLALLAIVVAVDLDKGSRGSWSSEEDPTVDFSWDSDGWSNASFEDDLGPRIVHGERREPKAFKVDPKRPDPPPKWPRRFSAIHDVPLSIKNITRSSRLEPYSSRPLEATESSRVLETVSVLEATSSVEGIDFIEDPEEEEINKTPSADSESTSGVSVPDPRNYPERPTYEEFCDAIDAYSASTKGRRPPKPAKTIYDWYKAIIARKMSIEEQAMFLANICWETGGLVHTEEIACRHGNCIYGKYFGRGYIQLTWEYNYRDASRALFGNDLLVRHPELVAKVELAWRTADYYWQRHVSPILVSNDALANYDFGFTIMAINGQLECTGRAPQALERLRIYNEILYRWGIDDSRPGRMTGCYIDQYYFKANGFNVEITGISKVHEIRTVDNEHSTTPATVPTKTNSHPATSPKNNIRSTALTRDSMHSITLTRGTKHTSSALTKNSKHSSTLTSANKEAASGYSKVLPMEL